MYGCFMVVNPVDKFPCRVPGSKIGFPINSCGEMRSGEEKPRNPDPKP